MCILVLFYPDGVAPARKTAGTTLLGNAVKDFTPDKTGVLRKHDSARKREMAQFA
jgi:hypothetical protein